MFLHQMGGVAISRDLPPSLGNRSKKTDRGMFSNVMSLCRVHCSPISEDILYITSDNRIQNTPRQESKRLIFTSTRENTKTKLYVTENQDLRVKYYV